MPTPTTDHLIRALLLQGVDLVDLRGQLPTHATKHWLKRDPAKIVGAVFHHAAGQVDGIDGVKAVARYHVNPKPNGRNWPGIGYLGSFARSGVFHLHRDIEVHGAHADYDARSGSENADLIGLLVMGNFRGPHNDTPLDTQEDPTLVQVENVGRVVRALRSVWPGWVHEEYTGLWLHADLGKVACPGDVLSRLIREERERAVW